MAIAKIITVPDPILRRKSKRVGRIDKLPWTKAHGLPQAEEFVSRLYPRDKQSLWFLSDSNHKSRSFIARNKKIKALIRDLKDTLREEPKGVGLSAPQIGVLKQVLVIKDGQKINVFINPEIISSSKKTLIDILPKEKRYFEGCLSVPGVWGFVNRPAKVKVAFLTAKGEAKEEKFEMQKAVFIQHEIDHLNGILFTDRILSQNGKFYRLEKDKDGKNIFIELEIE